MKGTAINYINVYIAKKIKQILEILDYVYFSTLTAFSHLFHHLTIQNIPSLYCLPPSDVTSTTTMFWHLPLAENRRDGVHYSAISYPSLSSEQNGWYD